MTTSTIVVYADETDPDTRLAWKADATTLRNLTGWTLTAKVVNRDNTIALTKTTGITGGDGTATSNVVIAWTAAELATIDDKVTRSLRVTATQGSETAVFTVDTNGTLPRIRVMPTPVAAP